MSKAKGPSKVRQAYKFIESHSNEFNVTSMCRVLDVERSGYSQRFPLPLINGELVKPQPVYQFAAVLIMRD
jgi:hypothetical protein